MVTGFAAGGLVAAGAAVAGAAVAGAAVARAGAAVAGAAVAGATTAGAAVGGGTGVAAGAQAVNMNEAISTRVLKVRNLRSISFSFLMNRTDFVIETKKDHAWLIYFYRGHLLSNEKFSIGLSARIKLTIRSAVGCTNHELPIVPAIQFE
jgi:hypothetical protein